MTSNNQPEQNRAAKGQAAATDSGGSPPTPDSTVSTRARPGRVGKVSRWLTASGGIPAAVAFLLGLSLQGADAMDRVIPDPETTPGDLISRVQVVEPEEVSADLSSHHLQPYGSDLPAFPRGGKCSRASREAMAKGGHPVGTWVEVTLTNGSRGDGASEMFLSDFRVADRREEKPLSGVNVVCFNGEATGGAVLPVYAAGINLDQSDSAALSEDLGLEDTEFAAAVSLPPGDSVKVVFKISATGGDYSFALVANVYCTKCAKAETQLGGRRLRVYSLVAAAPFELMSADNGAKLSGGRQRFDCSRVINEDEAESEEGAAALAGGAPARCDLARVPAASEVNKIMQRIAAVEHEEAEQLAEEEQLPEEGGR